MPGLADTVRQRLNEEMKAKQITQRDLASLLNWSQSRVGKLLTGYTSLSVDDMGDVCAALEMSPVEAVRDHGLEFVADLTPVELRWVERFRQLPKLQDALLQILDVKVHTRQEHRGATLPTKPRGPRLARDDKKIAK